jgi:hypothetical protein
MKNLFSKYETLLNKETKNDVVKEIARITKINETKFNNDLKKKKHKIDVRKRLANDIFNKKTATGNNKTIEKSKGMNINQKILDRTFTSFILNICFVPNNIKIQRH